METEDLKIIFDFVIACLPYLASIIGAISAIFVAYIGYKKAKIESKK